MMSPLPRNHEATSHHHRSHLTTSSLSMPPPRLLWIVCAPLAAAVVCARPTRTLAAAVHTLTHAKRPVRLRRGQRDEWDLPALTTCPIRKDFRIRIWFPASLISASSCDLQRHFQNRQAPKRQVVLSYEAGTIKPSSTSILSRHLEAASLRAALPN